MAKYKHYKLLNKIEVWKDVLNYEGIYIISSKGRVKSLDRYDSGGRKRTGKILSAGNNKEGYKLVTLAKNGKLKTFKVHRLVAEAFIPNPDNKPEVDHINTIRYDNRAENLRWVTRKENESNETTKNHRSENFKGRILSEEHKKKIGKANGKLVYCVELDKVFESTSEASRQLGINKRNIASVCRGERNKAGGYHWKYVDNE